MCKNNEWLISFAWNVLQVTHYNIHGLPYGVIVRHTKSQRDIEHSRQINQHLNGTSAVAKLVRFGDCSGPLWIGLTPLQHLIAGVSERGSGDADQEASARAICLPHNELPLRVTISASMKATALRRNTYLNL
jgi:hypothetical protein